MNAPVINSPKNAVFFITKYPNKTNPNYLAKKKNFMLFLRRHRNEMLAKQGAGIIQKAYLKHAMANILKWASKTSPAANTPFVTAPVKPVLLTSTRNSNYIKSMINHKSFNNKNFQDTLKSFKNTHARNKLGRKINAAPEPPVRNGKTLREYMNAKKQYESNTRSWMKSMVRFIPWLSTSG